MLLEEASKKTFGVAVLCKSQCDILKEMRLCSDTAPTQVLLWAWGA